MTKLTIGIQGYIGSTNEQACHFFTRKHGWEDVEIKYLISTEGVLSALNNNEINYGVFAWESTGGDLVKETQLAIANYDFKKIDSVELPLDHAILQSSEVDKAKHIRIYSHPQALKEHKSFLVKEFQDAEFIDDGSTALAAKKLSDNEYPSNSLVIAPIACAKLYNLDTYLADIPTNKGCSTTFYLAEKP